LGIKPLIDKNKFVALMVLIIGFAKMLLSFGKSQEAIESAKKYILAATIAILIIGLSWLIVSWIFTIIYR